MSVYSGRPGVPQIVQLEVLYPIFTQESSSGIAIQLSADSPTGSDRTLSAHDSGDVTPKAENGHGAKAAAAGRSAAGRSAHGSPPAAAAGARGGGGDGSVTPQQLPSQPSSPARFKSKPLGTLPTPTFGAVHEYPWLYHTFGKF